MAKIEKMRINNDLYDLAGSGGGGGIIYIPGTDIEISPDGVISFIGHYSSEGDISKLREQLAQNQATVVGMINETNDGLSAAAATIHRLSEGIPEILNIVYMNTSEVGRLSSRIDQLPTMISSTVSAELSDSEFRKSIATSVLTQTVDAFEFKFKQLDAANSELQAIGNVTEITQEGIILSAAGNPDNSTTISNDGVSIKVNGNVVAEAKGTRFTCKNGFGIDDWIIVKQGDNNLVFYRGNN